MTNYWSSCYKAAKRLHEIYHKSRLTCECMRIITKLPDFTMISLSLYRTWFIYKKKYMKNNPIEIRLVNEGIPITIIKYTMWDSYEVRIFQIVPMRVGNMASVYS